jgi:hypothetical protein
MHDTHDCQDSAITDMQDRPETPPPPYNLEDSNPHSSSTFHNPELAELESGIPYKVRGLKSPPVRYFSPKDGN